MNIVAKNENTRKFNLRKVGYLLRHMKNLRYSFVFLVSILFFFNSQAQEVKIGLLASPTISWMSVNDASITSKAALAGITMGVKLDYGLSTKWYLTLGTALSLNEGGKLQYRDGGNYLPLSELKLPQYNKGPKPIADNSTIEYHGQFWSSSLGIKSIIKETADSKVYLEFPTFNVYRLIKARGTILNNDKVLTDEEDIMQDLRQWNLVLSGGIGIEKRISRNAMFYSSLQYIHFLSDLTLNNGYKSLLITKGADPANDIYELKPDHSKSIINGLALTIGLYF